MARMSNGKSTAAEDVVLLFALLVGSAVLGLLYFQFILGLHHTLWKVVGLGLFPSIIVMSFLAWRFIIIPILLMRLAGDTFQQRVLKKEVKDAPRTTPGRFVFLLIPPLVSLPVGVGLGLLPRLSFFATALQFTGLGILLGVVLFVLTGRNLLGALMEFADRGTMV